MKHNDMNNYDQDPYGWLLSAALAFALLGMALLLGVPLTAWGTVRRWWRR